MDVTIDGVEYAPRDALPASSARLKIGVAISTYDRPERLLETVLAWVEHTPLQWPIVVVDDASTVPLPKLPERVYVYRMEENAGIAAVKNKSIELLEDRGVQHMFLSDDDHYPTTDSWWAGYVNHSEPHLMYQFWDFASKPFMGTNKVIYENDSIRAYAESRGCMIYIDADIVLPVVGGLDTYFGRWGYEHTEWSDRMHSAGLTSFRYADHPDSGEHFHSMDEHHEVPRTVQIEERKALSARNHTYWLENFLRGRTDWLPYRPQETRTAVIGVLYNLEDDPQRRGHKMSLEATTAWRESVKKVSPDSKLILFTDQPHGEESTYVSAGWNVYWDRFYQAKEWLKENSQITHAFLTDTTDVIMLNTPWEHLEPGTLYAGYEPKTLLNNKWIENNMKLNYDKLDLNKPILNCGIVGGDRETLIEFLTAFTSYKATYEHLTHIGEATAGEILEMPAFNLLLQSEQWKHRIQYGPHITTLFKSEEKTNTGAWWKHK